MKRYVQWMAALVAGLIVGCSTTGPEQRCRDKSDATASISYDYCVWKQQSVTQPKDDRRTTSEWYSMVAWPSSSSQQRMPATKDHGDRIFR